MKPLAIGAFAVATLAVSGTAMSRPATPGPAGVYELVALRQASGIAHPLREGRWEPRIGAKVRIGARSPWLDGQPCLGEIRPAPDPSARLNDPMLSDVEMAPLRGVADLRLNRAWSLNCGDGRAKGAVIPLLQVDRQVVVATIDNGETLAVLERPTGRGAVRLVEERLAAAGFKPGRIDGILDPQTRRALGQYSKSLGSAYAFESGALTENLTARLAGS